MPKLGFKEITKTNWLQPDDVFRTLVKMSPEGAPLPVSAEDILEYVLKPKLVQKVPVEVQALFEVARGAMVYGFLFYPLYALATEQLSRVAEAAIAHKCRELNTPKSTATFKERVGWLASKGILSGDQQIRWDTIRRLRNSASHPEGQSILMPGHATRMLESVAADINSLFTGL